MPNIDNKATTAGRQARLGFRLTHRQEQLIRRAAEATHKNVTDFVLDSACTAAEQALLDRRLFLVDEASWQRFQAILERPAEAKPGLRKLLETPPPWEQEL